jgi:hypothetical protein
MSEYTTDNSQVVSVWSAYGHRFMSTDSPEHESCLTCGAMYQLLALSDDPTRGEYLASNGDAPMECSQDTSMSHGYPGERVGDNVDHICNCVACA